MIDARLRIQLPEDVYITTVSETFPDATFRLLSGLRVGDHAVELGEVVTDSPREVSEALATHRSVTAYEQLETTEERGLAKYETTDIGLYELAEGAGLPLEYPIVVRDGWYELDITGTREEFKHIKGTIEECDRPYELVSITQLREDEDLLTTRQRETLNAALRAGYFEIPRDCTLAEVAETLELNKSTVSRVLRRGQARLVNWYLTGPDSSSEQPRGW